MKRKPCSGPFKYKFIAANGDVLVCCLDTSKQLVVGNVKEDTLEGIWDSERAHRIRMAHIKGDLSELPVCQKCPNLDSPQISEEEIQAYLKSRRKTF
jgi:radical SAM protein with 4Fe4S-binding SPASM domain